MYKLGLKLWSINENYVKEAIRLFEKGIYHYIELFVISGSYDKFINLWKHLNIPYVIHAPHSYAGLNTAKKEDRNKNLKLINEILKFANDLNAEIIIFHPGVEGEIEETAFQLCQINDTRVVVENKPYVGLKDEICNGATIEEIKFVLQKAKVGFCLDVSHAIISANAQGLEQFSYLKAFNELRPKIYHLSDGDCKGVYDEHKNLGKGSYDLKKIVKEVLPKYCCITIETKKKFKDSLSDFEKDVSYLNNLLKK
jgi:deoxyribonuclease IV